MPYLVVGGTTVNVSAQGVQHDVVEVGDRDRAFDGTGRSTIRDRKSVWTVPTKIMTRANADTLVGVLTGTQPLTCSGDLIGSSKSCNIEYQGTRHVPGPEGAERVVVLFTMHEV